MNILVDTCVWSEAFRRSGRQGNNPVADHLLELIREGRVLMLGPVRQETLSGIRDKRQFLRLKEFLREFPDIALVSEDFEAAADLYNQCRASGIQGSNTDFLICAVAARIRAAIFTTDRDFRIFAKHADILLHEIGRKG